MGDLVDLGNISKIAVPQLQWGLLDFGRTSAAIAQTRAGREEAEAQYRQVVLGALQDAEMDVAIPRFRLKYEDEWKDVDLDQSVDRNSVVRKMQVMKMRGQAPIPGLHTFRITQRGVQVFPRIPEQQLADVSRELRRIRPLARARFDLATKRALGVHCQRLRIDALFAAVAQRADEFVVLVDQPVELAQVGLQHRRPTRDAGQAHGQGALVAPQCAAVAQTTVKDPWIRGTVAQQKATALFAPGGELLRDGVKGRPLVYDLAVQMASWGATTLLVVVADLPQVTGGALHELACAVPPGGSAVIAAGRSRKTTETSASWCAAWGKESS